MTSVLDRLSRHRIVPVVTVHSVEQALRITDALDAGGLPVAEITFRTDAAADALSAVSERRGILVGAGTVLSPEQVDTAVAAGAAFIVSPGMSASVLERCRVHGVPVLPGAVTATEIQAAWEAGVRTVKFFPAEASGGTAALQALAAPFGDVRFVPTGGISPANLRDYLAIPSVAAVGGSWMLPEDAVRDGDWARVTELTREAVATAAAHPRR